MNRVNEHGIGGAKPGTERLAPFLRFGLSDEIPRHSQRQGYLRWVQLETYRVEETLPKLETSFKQASVLRIAELSPSCFDWMHCFPI
jgi:hypothetical protein